MKKDAQTANLLSLKDFLDKHQTIVTERQMRRFMRNRPWNNAGKFVHKIGGFLFIDEKKFFEWTKERGNSKK
jgi:hypothetical protein